MARWLAILLVGACDPSPLPVPEPQSNADLAFVCGPEITRGQSILVPCVTQLEFRSTGGLRPPVPPGSTCSGTFSATVDLASRHFSFDKCVFPRDIRKDPWVREMGSRTLSPVELDGVLTALRRVVVADSTYDYCDQPLMTIAVTTSNGSLSYTDATFGCGNKPSPGGTYAKPIEDAFTVVWGLAHL